MIKVKKVIHRLNKAMCLVEQLVIKYMNSFKSNYDKILEVLTSITKKEQFLRQNRKPKLKDIELIAMNLTAEHMVCNLERFLLI